MSVCILSTHPALAQVIGPCVYRADFLDHLSRNYREVPVAMGLTLSGTVLEVVANLETGTWTIIKTYTNGVTCGVDAGESWETMEKLELEGGT